MMYPATRQVDQLSIVDTPQPQITRRIHNKEGANGLRELLPLPNRMQIKPATQQIPQEGQGGEAGDKAIEGGQDPGALFALREVRAGEVGAGEDVEEAMLD